MSRLLRMAALEPGAAQGTLLEWLVSEGESVAAADTIATAETAAETGPVIAPTDGVLREQFIPAGASVPPGTPIGIIAGPDEVIDDRVASAQDSLEQSHADTRHSTAMPHRTVTASTDSGLSGRLEAGPFAWRYDEPADYGGTETGPTPVDVFLGGLAACLSLSVRFQAEKRDVAVDAISVTAAATPDHGPVESLEATIRLETDADDDTVGHLVEIAERGCHVSQLLSEEVAPTVSWERY
ncbi:osmotically inducible protein OsmC [Natronolimnobius sp. AArcel1]|uniref:OsmC family protein n=1 Tax=Natronolimnobius sp. AArcel1 TaxID=1679093 RepID=UPI0013ED5D18|nr:OsmC family protein [Natronolimnobius sp. AArcel1]NGM71141.1 osmotically inducible protein OsmC [Natronolimnobius sp. AArcel1]